MSHHNIGTLMGQTTRRTARPPYRSRDPFWSLVAMARRLHGPRGCAWDRAQTIQSLLPHLVEESWEVFDAARRGRRAALREELGDLLYTIVFLTLIAERRRDFTLRGLLTRTRTKMIRRHPHVFRLRRAHTSDEAYASWQTAKRREHRGRRRSKTLRPLLVELWETLRKDPSAPRRLRRQVRGTAGTSASTRLK